MKIDQALSEKLELAITRKATALVTRVLTWSAEHGLYGMDLVDSLHGELPATTCDNCGRCCNSISLFSLEYHRIIRELMATLPPSSLRGAIIEAMTIGSRLRASKDGGRLRCAFRDEVAQRCRIHAVRSFACRFFGMRKADNTRECAQVRELDERAPPLTEERQVELQTRILENSEQHEPFPGHGAIAFFPLEFWLWRAAFGPNQALDLYRRLLVPASGALTRFWRDRGVKS